MRINTFEWKGNVLCLRISRAPYLVLAVYYVFAFLSIGLPILGIILTISDGDQLHFAHGIGLVIFGLLSFFLLRNALWNTRGVEEFEWEEDAIIYIANYGWWKDGRRTIALKGLNITKKTAGYLEDNHWVLVLENGDIVVKSVVKLPLPEIENLIEELKRKEPKNV